MTKNLKQSPQIGYFWEQNNTYTVHVPIPSPLHSKLGHFLFPTGSSNSSKTLQGGGWRRECFGKMSERPFSTKPRGGYSGFQVMGMIEWSQKSRPKKILRAFSKTPKKSLDQKLTPQNSHADLVALKSSRKG